MHQSYLDFFSSIQDASKAVENLSYAEPFFNEWTVSNFRTKKLGRENLISKTVNIFFWVLPLRFCLSSERAPHIP